MKRTFLALGLVLTVLVGTSWAIGPYEIQVGDTTPEVTLYIGDSATSLAETGVTHATIDHLYYKREGATSSTAISPVELATEDAAWTAGGFIHTNNGLYRLCLPTAAIAAGAAYVVISGDETDMVVFPEKVNIVGYDPADGVRLGLTALPNAAADAAGGLPVSDTGGLNMDALLSLATTLEGSIDLGEFMRILLAVSAGKTSGAGTSQYIFYGQDGTTPRVTSTMTNGNRSTVLLDGAL